MRELAIAGIRAAYSNASQVEVKAHLATGGRLFVKTPEDTILRKLLWYRDGGCVFDRQWRDVVSVLRVSARRLDYDYLVKRADDLHVMDLLSRARSSAPD